ncbi:MAG: GNAT family N-acetyltransferase [Bacteroidia bacterium]|nr:GNAT family N-acetyltransferase [Bacteroidia bacterium]
MNLIEVKDKKTKQEFHDTARILYKDDTNWVCPLDIEIENIFNPAANRCFENGEASRWILKDKNDRLIGRIGAFYDKIKANKNEYPIGGIGFFECINDTESAFILFSAAKEWLASKGMQAMDGPVNFGENFVHWGLLVEGFVQQSYGMPYNPPYYKELFEKFGFRNYFEQYTYLKTLDQPFPERQVNFARHIGSRPEYSFEHFSFCNSRKYISDFVYLFNEIWSDFHEDYVPLEYKDIESILYNAKPILNEDFIWFAYDNGKPVGITVVFPDINQIIKSFRGKLNLINKIKLMLRRKKVTRCRQLLTGIIPSHQRTFIIGPLFLKLIDTLKHHNIKELEMSWVGDYNVTVNKIYQTLDIPIVRRHITYRYLFDKNIEFKRFTNEQSNKMKKIRK